MKVNVPTYQFPWARCVFSVSNESIHVAWLAICNRVYNHANILNVVGLTLQEISWAQSKVALGFESWDLRALLYMHLAEKVPLIFGPWVANSELAKCVNKHWSSCYDLAKLFFVHLIKLVFTSLKSFPMPPVQNSHYLKGELGQHFLYLLWKKSVISYINSLIRKEYLKNQWACSRKGKEKSGSVLLWRFFFFNFPGHCSWAQPSSFIRHVLLPPSSAEILKPVTWVLQWNMVLKYCFLSMEISSSPSPSYVFLLFL